MVDGLSFEIEKQSIRMDQLLDEWLKGARGSGYLQDDEVHILERDFANTVLEMRETMRRIKEAETLMVNRRIYSEAAIEEKAREEAEAAAAAAEAEAEAEAAEREQEYLKERERGYWK